MSGALTGGSLFASIGMQAAGAAGILPAFIRAPRKIGTIIPDVTIEEQHTDRLNITRHPVASGQTITDHSYWEPSQVVMRVGFSNSNIVGAAVGGFMSGGLSGALGGLASSAMESRAKEIYAQLLELQRKREPFDVTTGKRTYKDMLISELTFTNDASKEYALIIDVTMQEVLIVNLTTTSQLPGQGAQGSPERTAETTPTGDKQTRPESWGHSMFGNVGASIGKFLGF